MFASNLLDQPFRYRGLGSKLKAISADACSRFPTVIEPRTGMIVNFPFSRIFGSLRGHRTSTMAGPRFRIVIRQDGASQVTVSFCIPSIRQRQCVPRSILFPPGGLCFFMPVAFTPSLVVRSRSRDRGSLRLFLFATAAWRRVGRVELRLRSVAEGLLLINDHLRFFASHAWWRLPSHLQHQNRSILSSGR
jgi:hypothetical protein